jgi:hypothetical protein
LEGVALTPLVNKYSNGPVALVLDSENVGDLDICIAVEIVKL